MKMTFCEMDAAHAGVIVCEVSLLILGYLGERIGQFNLLAPL